METTSWQQWMTPFVHIISASSGEVLSTKTYRGLHRIASGDRNEVMNGITWDEDSEDIGLLERWTYLAPSLIL